MTDRLKTFVQRMLDVAPAMTDIGGGVIPSLSGSVNAGSDTAQQLHHAIVGFTRAYNDLDADEAAVQKHAQIIEGLLMTSVTLGMLAEGKGSDLINELHGLVEAR